jgi:RNA polymerase sigma factor (sigma-70 family)
MYEASTDRGDDILPKTLLDSLLPQINGKVRWACHYYHHFPDQSIIDDLSQEITISLIKNDFHDLRSFERRSTEKTWLQVVVLHHVSRHFKSQKPTESLEYLPVNSFLPQPPSQEMIVLFRERQKLVANARGALTVRELELWDSLCNELTDGEIAKQMRIKVRSVQRNKSTLLRKIGSLIKRLGAGSEQVLKF